jgi:hypothetical protein
MNLGKIGFGLASLLALVAGCAGKTVSDDPAETAGADLSSSVCPPKIEVKLDAADIESDAQIKAKLMSPSQGMSEQEASEQMTEIADHLKLARADKAVTLTGTLQQACFYKTTRSPAGDNQYSMHFAKTSSGFSLRVEQLMDGHNGQDELFINAAVNSVSATSLDATPGTTGFISAEDIDRGHDGSDGFSVFIGTTKVTAKLAN